MTTGRINQVGTCTTGVRSRKEHGEPGTYTRLYSYLDQCLHFSMTVGSHCRSIRTRCVYSLVPKRQPKNSLHLTLKAEARPRASHVVEFEAKRSFRRIQFATSHEDQPCMHGTCTRRIDYTLVKKRTSEEFASPHTKPQHSRTHRTRLQRRI